MYLRDISDISVDSRAKRRKFSRLDFLSSVLSRSLFKAASFRFDTKLRSNSTRLVGVEDIPDI